MKRYIILSVNDNPEYLQYIPLTCWSWKQIGWEPIVFYLGDHQTELFKLVSRNSPLISFWWLKGIEGYRDDTVTQVSRLYGASLPFQKQENDIIMLGDADMLACSDYWNPDPTRINIYGHDLTNYQDIPICYIAMTREKWVEVMGLTSGDYNALIKRDLDTLPQAKSTDFYKYWGSDQNLITQRINAVNFDKVFISRGRYPNGYAIGRIDRGIWSVVHERFIDCHQHRDLYKNFKENNPLWVKKWTEHLTMLSTVWPKENFDWYFDFIQKFASMV